MSGEIDDVAALEARVGKIPGPMHLKVIDHLDAGAASWLAASPLMFAGFGSIDGIAMSLGGGEPGFASVIGASRMRLSMASLENPGLARASVGFGALFLIPSIGETLRVNGRVAAVDSEAVEVLVEECYVHCAKALIRSELWTTPPQPSAPSTPADFLAASRFLALATVDATGRCDVSPKGDPAGSMIRLSEGAVWFADRPGNRRTDSFRNILTQPRVAAAALIPGAASIAVVSGTARLTGDEGVRAGFRVHDRTPSLVTRIEQPSIVLRQSAVLARARLWPARAPAAGIDPAAMIVAHVRLSKQRGLHAALVRNAVSIPRLVQKGLALDYKHNLY